MKGSSGKKILIGCSALVVILLLAAGAVLWLIFGALNSINNNMKGGYIVSGGKVNFYSGLGGFSAPQSWEIKEADAATFKVVGEGYAADKNFAYLDGVILPQSSGSTFKIIQKPYSADQNHIYFEKWLISDSPNEFKIILRNEKGIVAADGKKVFLGAKELFPETIDVRSFEQIGATSYFRDKNHVYTLEKIVENADPETFAVVSDYKEVYAKDKSSVFYEGVKVTDCDVKTHKVLSQTIHSDARRVFFTVRKLSDDAVNFRVLTENYSKDRKNVYWYDKKLDKADAATFVGLNDYYGKDKNSVWFGVSVGDLPETVEKADAATFEIFPNDPFKAKDKNNIFDGKNISSPHN